MERTHAGGEGRGTPARSPRPGANWPHIGSIASEIQREIRRRWPRREIDKEELQRDLAEARADIAEAMAEIDAHRAEIRRAGQDPEQLKAIIRASLKAVENIDVEAITRRRAGIGRSRARSRPASSAEAAIRAAEAELDRIDDLDDDDDD